MVNSVEPLTDKKHFEAVRLIFEKLALHSRLQREVRYASHLEVTRLYLNSFLDERCLTKSCWLYLPKFGAMHVDAPGDRNCDVKYQTDENAKPFVALIFSGLLKRRFFVNVNKLIKAWERESISFATS